ncbi:MAG: TIGR03759 family integrating conjugative element protein [Parahaliea sp.]
MTARTVAVVVTLLATCQMSAAGALGQQSTRIVETTAFQLTRQAAEWGLSETQYRHYQALMQGERGLWSPGLDPITALGVSTDSASERRQLAELFVRKEFERTRRELAFQVAVNEAWRRLYPDTPRVFTTTVGTGDAVPATRYAFVTRIGCESCERQLQGQLDALQRSAPVDLYVVGTDGDDGRLRSWADRHPDIVAALRERRLTLNHGTPFEGTLNLPVVYHRNAAGEWVEARGDQR